MLLAMLGVMIVISRTGMIVDRTSIPDLMVIPGSSGSLQMFKEELQDVQEDTTEVRCVAGPVLTRAQAKKSDKIHQLKLKKLCQVSTRLIEDLQKTLNKCFDRVEKHIIRENYVGEFYMKNGLLYWEHQDEQQDEL